MRPEEREDIRYSKGAENPIEIEERLMFSFLPTVTLNNQQKLLDIGCGIGQISLELKKRGLEVTGVDFSAAAVNKCLAQGLNAIKSDVDKDGLRFADNSFDVVWVSDVIEHVFDPIFLLKETNRVLKKDGKLIFSVPNDFNIYNRTKIFLTGQSIQSKTYKDLGQCKHHTFFSWELLNYMLAKTKFVIDRYYSILRFPKLKREVIIQRMSLGRIFGKIFIISAHKT